MRKLLLLALGIGATVMVRRRAAEQGITPPAVIGNMIEQATAWLSGFPSRSEKKA